MQTQIVLSLLLATYSQAIRLERNAYKDVLIAINDQVPEDTSLLQTIQDTFTKASQYLYEATKKRAYFDEITIVVPESWKDSKKYEAATAKETFDAAKVRINPAEEFFGIVSHRAYVVPATTPCGEEGHYMHITPGRLTDPNWIRASSPYRMIVHEWAHLRWGVFDEYYDASRGLDYDNRPGRCPKRVKATRDQLSGQWGYDTNGATGSIMWKQYINQVVDFCDDGNNSRTKHYRESNTAQNLYCNMKSVWTVMKSTPDFANGANPPRDVKSTAPTFRIVRKKSADAVVLVLDVSKAMFIKTRMTRLRQATKDYLDSVESGSHIGIIFFKNKVTTRRRLFQLNSQKSRERASRSLPTRDIAKQSPYRKSIAAGIRKAIEMLKESRIEKKEIVVATDGVETMKPFLNDSKFMQEVKESNVKINTIEIGSENQWLSKLAISTGGKTFMDSDMVYEPSVLGEAFTAFRESNLPLAERQYFTSSEIFAVSPRSTKTKATHVDPGLGLNTNFKFYWTPDSIKETAVTIRVTDPKRREFSTKNGKITCATGYAMCTLQVPGLAKTGKWSITVENKSDRNVMFSYSVTSKKQGQNPISLESFINSLDLNYPASPIITAIVKKGELPVIDATVVAVVTRPSGDVLNISMNDNGIGADMVANDGTYSARFTQYSSDGNYNVKIIATADSSMNRRPNDHGTHIHSENWQKKRAKIGQPVIRDDYDIADSVMTEMLPLRQSQAEDFIDINADTFSRTEAAGMFRVVGYEEAGRKNSIPPGTVTNLVGTKQNEFVKLTWTAPGADMENEQADHYEIRIGKSFDDLVDRFSNQYLLTQSHVVGSESKIDSPKMPGLVESLQFRNPLRSDVIYVALKTRDQGGLLSLISNVVKIKFECKCPERKNPTICKNEVVIYGTVEQTAGSKVTLAPGIEYLKTGTGLSGGFGSFLGTWRTQVSVDLPNKASSAKRCDCTKNLIRKGEAYILSATLNLKTFQLEVNNNSYIQRVAADQATRTKNQVKNLLRRC